MPFVQLERNILPDTGSRAIASVARPKWKFRATLVLRVKLEGLKSIETDGGELVLVCSTSTLFNVNLWHFDRG